MPDEIEQLEGFIHCDECPMLNVCKYGSAGASILLGKFEGIDVKEEQIKDLNRLIRIMNKLVKSCPLVKVLEERDCRTVYNVKAS